MACKTLYAQCLLARVGRHSKISQSQSLCLPQKFCYTTRLENRVDADTTVDQTEIGHHSKLMKEWWNPNGPLKSLHSFNLVRVPFVRDGLLDISENTKCIKPLKNKKILDIGCGGGILSEPLARLGATVTGVDASKELIECAKQHSAINPSITDNQPTYLCTSIEEHATTHENFYDGVVASEIIEHVNNKELFIKSCINTLKPGGRIFFTSPTRTRLSQFAIILLAEYVCNAIPRGTHQYEKFTTSTELTFLLERNNCQVEATYGIFYDILRNKWYFVTPQNLMFALQAVKLNQHN